MSDKALAQKLQIKPGRSVLLVDPPQDYAGSLEPLPEGATVLFGQAQPADIIQAFVKDRQQLEEQLTRLKNALQPGGILWVTYYKGTARVKTDINRDTINAYAHTLGMEGVAMISIDDHWSALRLKITG